MSAEQDQAYLGNGVYVHHDGYQLWLTTAREQVHSIALEPKVFEALVQYEKALRAKYAAPLDEATATGPSHSLE